MRNPKYLYIGNSAARLDDPISLFNLMEEPNGFCYRINVPADMDLTPVAPKAKAFSTNDPRKINDFITCPVINFDGKYELRPPQRDSVLLG